MGWPIRTVSLEAFDGAFARNSFGPAIELAEVAFLGEGDGILPRQVRLFRNKCGAQNNPDLL